MISSATMANDSGTDMPSAIAPAAASTASISCVAYAVEDSASDANTARPTILRIACCGRLGGGKWVTDQQRHPGAARLLALEVTYAGLRFVRKIWSHAYSGLQRCDIRLRTHGIVC